MREVGGEAAAIERRRQHAAAEFGADRLRHFLGDAVGKRDLALGGDGSRQFRHAAPQDTIGGDVALDPAIGPVAKAGHALARRAQAHRRGIGQQPRGEGADPRGLGLQRRDLGGVGPGGGGMDAAGATGGQDDGDGLGAQRRHEGQQQEQASKYQPARH